MINPTPFDNWFASRVLPKTQVRVPEESAVPTITRTSGETQNLFESFGGVDIAQVVRYDVATGVGGDYSLTGKVDITRGFKAAMLRESSATSTGTVNPGVQLDISEYISPVDLTDPALPGIMINGDGDLIVNLIKLAGDEVLEISALSGGEVVKIIYGVDEL